MMMMVMTMKTTVVVMAATDDYVEMIMRDHAIYIKRHFLCLLGVMCLFAAVDWWYLIVTIQSRAVNLGAERGGNASGDGFGATSG